MSSYTSPNYFNYTHEFTSEKGLHLAFGFGEFSSGEKKTYEEIKDYGTLRAIKYSWDVDADPILWTNTLKTKPCSDDDLERNFFDSNHVVNENI
jgi:hypothetical protein